MLPNALKEMVCFNYQQRHTRYQERPQEWDIWALSTDDTRQPNGYEQLQ